MARAGNSEISPAPPPIGAVEEYPRGMPPAKVGRKRDPFSPNDGDGGGDGDGDGDSDGNGYGGGGGGDDDGDDDRKAREKWRDEPSAKIELIPKNAPRRPRPLFAHLLLDSAFFAGEGILNSQFPATSYCRFSKTCRKEQSSLSRSVVEQSSNVKRHTSGRAERHSLRIRRNVASKDPFPFFS